MHDNPDLYPHLPSKPIDEEAPDFILESVRDTVWQTCWEYVLTHELTEGEGSAFWHGANLAYEAMRKAANEPQPVEQVVPSALNGYYAGVCPKCLEVKFIGHGPLCVDCFAGITTPTTPRGRCE